MNQGRDVEGLIRSHLKRRPHMRATDVYKLLYQGVFGVGHLLGESARQRLRDEARALNLDDQPEEQLIEVISADGSMLRVNLRSFLRRRLPLDKLFSAMEESSHEEGEVGDFLEAWGVFKHLVESGDLTFEKGEIEELDRQLEGGGCPPQHHSEVYRRTYKPAYRVVRTSVFERMFGPDELSG